MKIFFVGHLFNFFTCHGESSQRINDIRKKKVVQFVFELERLLRHEQTTIEDEQRIKDCQGKEQLVEQVPLHQGGYGHQGDQVAEQTCHGHNADTDSRHPEPIILKI